MNVATQSGDRNEGLPPDWMVLYSVKYALDHPDHILTVNQVVDYVIPILDNLSPFTRSVMRESIKSSRENSHFSQLSNLKWDLLLTAIEGEHGTRN